MLHCGLFRANSYYWLCLLSFTLLMGQCWSFVNVSFKVLLAGDFRIGDHILDLYSLSTFQS